MRRLILHIGAHKTGTTALQQCMKVNQERLLAAGAAFVASPGAVQLHGFLGFVTRDSLIPEGFRAADPEALASHLASGPADLVIGSSENFSFFFQKSAIEALEKALRPHFREIRIVSYLRRQDRHAVSHHQEGAKSNRRAEGLLWGHEPTALPVASLGQAFYLDYARRLGLWADVFGDENMDLRVYDRALMKDGDIVADFLAQAGLAVQDLVALGDKNVSLGAAQAKAGHLMNAAGLRSGVMDKILWRISSAGRLLPSRDEARAFLAPYIEGNRSLNRRFAISAAPDLFNDVFDDYPETAQSDWTDAGATSAMRSVLTQLSDLESGQEGLSADDLRIAAIALKERNPAAALRLLEAARKMRPDGKAILRLIAELQQKVLARS